MVRSLGVRSSDEVDIGALSGPRAQPRVAAYSRADQMLPTPYPERYAVVWTGTNPETLIQGSHLHLQLLPDYIVWTKGEILESGFLNNDWMLDR